MKVVAPTRLLVEAAQVLAEIRDDVVVVGAAALEVALLPESPGPTRNPDLVVVTPTRDIDGVVAIERAAAVVAHLEAVGLKRSDVPHERPFTWVRGDLKIQLVRTFHPFPKPPASGLPANPVFGLAARGQHQIEVAFVDEPHRPRLVCANSACLLALKQAAFGRTRPPDNLPVERDFHDAYLLVSSTPETLVEDLARADYEVRTRAASAVLLLAAGGDATAAAGRQMVRLRSAASQREAEAAVRRAAVRMQQRLGV